MQFFDILKCISIIKLLNKTFIHTYFISLYRFNFLTVSAIGSIFGQKYLSSLYTLKLLKIRKHMSIRVFYSSALMNKPNLHYKDTKLGKAFLYNFMQIMSIIML